MPGRGRPHLPVGAWGDIFVKPAAHSTRARPVYVARARFRDSDGVTRPVTKTGQSQAAAKTALLETLASRQRRVQAAAVDRNTTVGQLATLWWDHTVSDWAPNTQARYELNVKYVREQLGQVRLQELSRSGINTALMAVRDKHGVRSAQMAKTTLSSMCKYALQFDALDSNPVRDAITISVGRRVKPPDAMTQEQVEDLCDKLRVDERAVVAWDLADLVEWMLGTGCRIGEACGARYVSLDETAGTWEINATAVRVKGRGMIVQERPKTAAGWRVLALPPSLMDMVRRRHAETTTVREGVGLLFPSPGAKAIRDPSNTHADLRTLLNDAGYSWVTSHTFRRTVATRLDQGGLTAREIADHLGHSQPSMTLDKYMGRSVASSAAASILDRT